MYCSRITREHRTAFILLTDRSGSMAEEVAFEGERMTKADAVAQIINRFLEELVNRCRREEGIRDYFDIAIVEYGGEGVRYLLGADGFITPSELAKVPCDTRTRHILRRLPGGNLVSVARSEREWITPRSAGNTPMGAALAEAEKLVRRWCSSPSNARSFPPTVINITDGEASDACNRVLCDFAAGIRGTGTSDGNTLLLNIHLAQGNREDAGVSFPCSPDELPPHHYARLLWDMSSLLPECYEQAVSEGRAGAMPPFRAISYNCAVDELFSMLTIGSVSGAMIG